MINFDPGGEQEGTQGANHALVRWASAALAWAAARAVRPIRTVRVWSRRPEKREKFAADMNATVAASAEEAVRGAQIVVTATYSKDPVLENAWIGPGVHINAIGSNMPNRRELPEALVRRAGVIAVDALDAARVEAGDLILPDCWSNVVELQSITPGWTPDRVSIFKSVGLGMEDVAVGSFVYEQALVRGAGKPLYS